MTPRAFLFATAALAGAAALSWAAAVYAVRVAEEVEGARLSAAFNAAGLEWPQVQSDGLRVTLSGTAPDERARFAAIEVATSTISARRLIDQTELATDVSEEAPIFYLQVLRRTDSATLMGLVPDDDATRSFRRQLALFAPQGVKDSLLATSAHTAPKGWPETLELALSALEDLEQARIDLTPQAMNVSGMVVSGPDLAALGDRLRAQSGGIELTLDLTAPLPVRSPYVFSGTRTEAGIRITQCSAESSGTRAAIVGAAGHPDAVCELALGAPTPDWPVAVSAGLGGLMTLDGGRLEVVNTELRLTSRVGADPVRFAAAAARIEAALPVPFTLATDLRHARAPATDLTEAAPMRFTALRTEDGAVRIRGDLRDAGMQRTTASFAKAHFGFDAVVDETVLRPDLPPLWYTRVLVGLEALSMLRTGEVEVMPDGVVVTGMVGSDEDSAAMKALLKRKLPDPEEAQLDIFVDPTPARPKMVSAHRAEFCATQIETVLARTQILFPPGETAISQESLPVVDAIATILGDCPGARFEIEGHTDSQGRESSNLEISQDRARAVMDALVERGSTLVFLSYKGYGETRPMVENDTEEGRALNRRITFRLIAEAAVEVEEETVVESAQPATHDGSETQRYLPSHALDNIAGAAARAEIEAALASDIIIETANGMGPTEPGPDETSPELIEATADEEVNVDILASVDPRLRPTLRAVPDLPSRRAAYPSAAIVGPLASRGEDLTPSGRALVTSIPPRPRPLGLSPGLAE
ncbi:MAG: OmpA family protein [Pseudomonadota bacterium]